MATVEHPRFTETGQILCHECPFADREGNVTTLCSTNRCPNRNTYADAAALAAAYPAN